MYGALARQNTGLLGLLLRWVWWIWVVISRRLRRDNNRKLGNLHRCLKIERHSWRLEGDKLLSRTSISVCEDSDSYLLQGGLAARRVDSPEVPPLHHRFLAVQQLEGDHPTHQQRGVEDRRDQQPERERTQLELELQRELLVLS